MELSPGNEGFSVGSPAPVRSVPLRFLRETLSSGYYPTRFRLISGANPTNGNFRISPFLCTMIIRPDPVAGMIDLGQY